VPSAFAGKGTQDGVTPPMLKFDMGTAFWALSLVANWAYSNWHYIYPDFLAAIIDCQTDSSATSRQTRAQFVFRPKMLPDAFIVFHKCNQTHECHITRAAATKHRIQHPLH
jgi:hypothetical protein